MRIAEQQANKLCRQSQNTAILRTYFSDNDVTETDVTRDGPLFSVGRSSFFQSSQCVVEVNCSKKTIQLEGTMTFEIKDWFKDPLDIGIELPGAKVYKIVAKWSQPINFIYDRLGTGRWVRN